MKYIVGLLMVIFFVICFIICLKMIYQITSVFVLFIVDLVAEPFKNYQRKKAAGKKRQQDELDLQRWHEEQTKKREIEKQENQKLEELRCVAEITKRKAIKREVEERRQREERD